MTENIPKRKIINMTIDKQTIYYAVLISYPDGTNDYYFHLTNIDLIELEKNFI